MSDKLFLESEYLIRAGALLRIIFFLIIVPLAIYPFSVVVHEFVHYISFTLEGIKVTSFHILDMFALSNGWAGYVDITHESRYGIAFQENIAHAIQYLFQFTCSFCILFLTRLGTYLSNQVKMVRGIDVKGIGNDQQC